ncbi:site-specific tyrosine recombinase XerC [Streptomonospora litoralis]|uniref:Site-specific tyrosine recombinase XerC n=1 Tax=Streptomonospora litoralis TaxID=2498135 RepID=A0A4P6Q7T1_9ACTN|nr:site-specific tyrosine recombinase XerC [Streptomonospora litoralis]
MHQGARNHPAGHENLRGARPLPGHTDETAPHALGPGTFTLGAPKTKQSRRRIALSPRTIALIQPRLEGKDPEDYVFTTEQGAWWRHSSFYNRRWTKAVQRAQAAGLTKRPRIHDLRHTHVSWLIEENVHAFKIQRRLGHKSITTTMDRYGHLVTDLDDDLLSAMSHRRSFSRNSGVGSMRCMRTADSSPRRHIRLPQPPSTSRMASSARSGCCSCSRSRGLR